MWIMWFICCHVLCLNFLNSLRPRFSVGNKRKQKTCSTRLPVPSPPPATCDFFPVESKPRMEPGHLNVFCCWYSPDSHVIKVTAINKPLTSPSPAEQWRAETSPWMTLVLGWESIGYCWHFRWWVVEMVAATASCLSNWVSVFRGI